MNHRLCILNRENFEIVKSKKIWGVADRQKNQLLKAALGDKLVFYLIDEVYPHHVKIKPLVISETELLLKPLIAKLEFITNKRQWSET